MRRFRVRRGSTGQSLVEFSLVLPLMLFLVVAIADFGRIYTSAVAVESAAREAADFGAFHASYWDPVNRTVTVGEMERRACTAASGSHLEGYTEPPGTVNHATCTNPVFSYTLEPDDPSCSDPVTEPPCVVHVRIDYDFNMIVTFPPLPATFHIQRDIRFRMADLTPP
jgi:TadE-like protein